jgi:hypothetical protein
MELQCQGEVSEGEGLIGVDFCFCEMERAGGKVEGVSMPVKNG